MKLSLSWLKDYVAVPSTPDDFAHRLTMAGHEVKGISDVNGDKIFEIEVTPNRPDCLNVIGLARETSAIVNKKLRLPVIPKIKLPKQKADVSIKDGKDCLRYSGALVEDVRIAASPDGLKTRLSSIGLRSINNVVDITNFCLMETGQPLHAFDYDKLSGGKIIVRRARAGEKIITIDCIEYELDPSILVIADAERPVAIAGIMGGRDTEVTDQTKRVLLESACFDPVLIRRAGRKLGITSDSSYRFERGTDFNQVENCSRRALDLILKSSGGRITAYSDVKFKKEKSATKTVTVNNAGINRLLGASVPVTRTAAILKALGFSVTRKGREILKVAAPSFRNDIKADVDICEEIARILGYDNLPETIPAVKPGNVFSDEMFIFKKHLRRTLCALGLDEVITYPMISRGDLMLSESAGDRVVKVQNPLSNQQEVMRPSLFPSLLAVLRTNQNRGQKNICVFELGKAYFFPRKDDDKAENEFLGILLTGERQRDWRHGKKQSIDFYDIKGVVAGLIQVITGHSSLYLEKYLEFRQFDKGEAAVVKVEGKAPFAIGCLGKVDKKILKNWDIKDENVYYAEIEIESLENHWKRIKKYEPVQAFPAIVRDVSLSVARDVDFQSICHTALELGKEFLHDIEFIEQYIGDKIPAGRKGLVFSLVYQSPSRTLTDEEINPLHESIVNAFVEKCGAVIR